MEPIRIQRKRSKGWKMPENTVAVDHTTGFGNPFAVLKGKDLKSGNPVYFVGTWSGPALWIRETRQDAHKLSVNAYSAWLDKHQNASVRRRAMLALKGKNLACFCPLDLSCHADILLALANAKTNKE